MRRTIFKKLAAAGLAGCCALILQSNSCAEKREEAELRRLADSTAKADSIQVELARFETEVRRIMDSMEQAGRIARARKNAEVEKAWLEFISDTVSYYAIETTDDASPYPLPLKRKLQNGVLLPKPFTAETAMRTLFGGRTFRVNKYYDSAQVLTFWRDSSRANDSVPGKFIGEFETLDFAEGVDTRYEDTLHFRDKKGNGLLLAVNSASSGMDFVRTGRFHAGILGLFEFREEEKGWRLVKHDLTVDAFGQFGNFSPPVLRAAGPQRHVVQVHDWFNGAGGPSHDYECFYALDGEGYKLLLRAYSDLDNVRYSQWSSAFEFDQEKLSPEGYGELIMTMKGEFARESFDKEEFKNFHPKLQAAAKRMELFSFTLVRRFRYEKGAYVETESVITTKPEKFPGK